MPNIKMNIKDFREVEIKPTFYIKSLLQSVGNNDDDGNLPIWSKLQLIQNVVEIEMKWQNFFTPRLTIVFGQDWSF